MKTIVLKVNKNIFIKTILTVILVSCVTTYVQLRRERSPYTRTIDRQINDAKNLTLTEKRTDDVILIPPDDVLKRMSEEELIKLYWKYVNSLQILCRTQTRIGSVEDGGKELCLDQSYLPKEPCIVYSFGMAGVFQSFFMMLKGRTIPKEISFHYIGLAGKDYLNRKRWKMNTLQTIIKENDHLGVTIDVLKIDIEGAEWDALPPFLESGLYKNVKQILLEIHVGRKRFWEDLWGERSIYKQLAVLRLLYESGFRIFQRERNLTTKLRFKVPPSDEITTVNEISLINVKYYSKGY